MDGAAQQAARLWWGPGSPTSEPGGACGGKLSAPERPRDYWSHRLRRALGWDGDPSRGCRVCRPANQAGATPWSCEGDHRSAGIVHTMPVARSRNQPGARWIMSDAFLMERRCSTPWGVTPAFGRHVRRPLGPHGMTRAAAGAERPSALQNRVFRHPMVHTPGSAGEKIKQSPAS